MEVLDRKQLGGTLFEPSRSGVAVAFGTMAIAARAVRDPSVATLIALVDVTAERPPCGRPRLLSAPSFVHGRVNLQTLSGKPGRGGGKCRPAPTLALSSNR